MSSAKTAADTRTNWGLWTMGLFSFAASGSITRGDILITAAPGNYVMASNTATDSRIIVGKAIDTASGGRVLGAVGVYN